jgi:NAD(P)-dependent dehydrogenase (short-subunit alcohol dehydrogenase family)
MYYLTLQFLLASLVVLLISSRIKRFVLDVKDVRVENQTGRTFIVTGANSGLGFSTALALARANATVVLCCRNTSRCNDAKKRILQSAPAANIHSFHLDLSSFSSIRLFAANFTDQFGAVDVLINNAGIMALPSRMLTEAGIEMQLGTNHVGHFMLTGLLFPHIRPGGRIITHSSMMHAMSSHRFPFEDPNCENYDPWIAYGNSKLSNLLFTFELNKRLELWKNPRNITAIAVHPGFSATHLQQERFPFWQFICAHFATTPEHGALSQIIGSCIYS